MLAQPINQHSSPLHKASILLLCLLSTSILSCTPTPFELENFSVKLVRNGQCFNCPWYSVSILQNGLVNFQGIAGTETRGERYSLLPTDSVEALAHYLLNHHVFALHDHYDTRKFFDGETITLTITYGSTKKVIVDHFGGPDTLHMIEHHIDEMSGAKLWVGSGPMPISPNTKEAKAKRREIDSLEAIDDEMLQQYEDMRENGDLRHAYHLFYNERKLSDSISKAYEYFFSPHRDSIP